MFLLDGYDTDESRLSTNGSLVKEDSPENGEPKQLSVLFCSEKAVYVYSLTHILQVEHISTSHVSIPSLFFISSCTLYSLF